MNPLTIRAESLALWLADYYLLASVLLIATLATWRFLKQPAQRLAIAKATIAALFLLAILCAIPGWSLVHLFTAERPRANGSQAEPLEAQPAADLPTIPAADPIDTESFAFSPPAAQQDEPPTAPKSATNWRDLPWAQIVVTAHGAGTVCVFAWLVLGAVAAHRLRRTAQPAPPDLIALQSAVATLQNISSRPPDLKISDRVDVAVALGIFRPTVLLPTNWLKSLAPEQLRSVLAHELAHVANHDLRWLAASRALVMLLWAQPLLWLVRRRMRLDQEALADAVAAELTSRESYAEQLVAWARQVPARPVLHLSAAVGLWEGPSQLHKRIALLIDEKLVVLCNCSRRYRVAAASFSLSLVVALSTVTFEPSAKVSGQESDSQENGSEVLTAENAVNYITGAIVNPDGTPATGVAIAAFSTATAKLPEMQNDHTDENGRFRIWLEREAEVIFFIWPKEYARDAHYLANRRGDLGKFTLDKGIQIRGRVVDGRGAPLPGVWVDARPDRSLGKIPITFGISDHIFRSALSDENGRFEMAPLPAGTFRVSPVSAPTEQPHEELRNPRPLSAAFEPCKIELSAGREPQEIEFRAVPSVAVTVQFVDSQGKSTRGVRSLSFLTGDIQGKLSFSARLSFDSNGKALVQAPHGLTDARIDFSSHAVSVRHRAGPEAPLSKSQIINLGTLDRNRQVEVIHYQAPTLVVDVRDLRGDPVQTVSVGTMYADIGPENDPGMAMFAHERPLSQKPDGRWHSIELLPDEAFTLKVSAEGYKPFEQTMALPEAMVKTLKVQLAKNDEPPESTGAATTQASQPIEIPIIVARYVLLHDGKIIEWADLEKMIAALPNPKLAQPGFYFTHGAAADRQEEVRTKIWDLRRRIPMHGHSWGSISPRTSPHYDVIRTADDLKPNDAWRISGTVETADSLPIDGAEVVLLMPVDESLPYKTLDLYLRNERLREPADEVVTTSDNSGRFAVYPRPETPYFLVALHREGFGLARSDTFAKSQRVTIQPWAHVRGEVKQDARFKQSASHSERVPADGDWPEITFHQYSEDLGPASPDGRFEFAFVPPNLDGTLSRSIQGEQGTSFGLPATKFKLPPGETLTVDLEPPSDEEAARVEMLKSADEQRQREAEAARAVEEARTVDPNELAGRVVDADGKPLSGVVVDVWTWHAGNETLTDADGRFKLGGFDDRDVVEVQFMKPGYGPALFVAQQVGDPNWTVTLANDTYLEGRVLDPAGKPLPNMRIRAARGPFSNPQVVIGEVWISTSTDGEGAYRLYVEPDKYDVHVRVPGVGLARLQNTALANGEKRQLDIQLRQGPTFRALVLDIETNEPVAGIRLWNWRQEGIEGVSDDAGMVTIENMTPGPFEFHVTAVGEPRGSDLAGKYARWWSPDATEEHQRKIEYDSSSFQRNFDDLTFNIFGNTEPVKIYMEKAVSIRGRVTDPDGNPVAGATVAPAKTGTGNSITGDTRYSLRTESDGTFHIRLPASNNAKYNLVAHDGDYHEWRNWANGVGEVLTTRPGQELADVALQLTRPGVVRGKVVDGDGKPMTKHRVRTQPTDYLENRYYDPETRTNENGEFELKFVRPGEHFVQADPFWLVDNDVESDASKRVTVKPGETVDGIELIHRPAESRPPIDHILPDVPIPRR